MVECECFYQTVSNSSTLSFNRYMVECEFEISADATNKLGVLIDTWWNVNNLFIINYSVKGFSFNRYMVECEFVSDKKGLQVTIGFNRYMVECELIIDLTTQSRNTGF